MESPYKPLDSYQSYKISWLSYLWLIIRFCIACCILFAIYHFGTRYVGKLFSQEDIVRQINSYVIYKRVILWLPIGLGLILLIKFIINFLTLKSTVLYTDDSGVWLFSGIFPWSKGTSGVKWIDLEDAIYVPNFLSWVLQTYDIRIGHRFTKTSEIIIKNVFKGKSAVLHINECHKKFIAKASAYTINAG